MARQKNLENEEVEMCIIISEVEGNMNNRPLNRQLLTPNHLTYGCSLTSVNENDLVEINENEMKKMKVFTSNLLKQFKGKFKNEYLLALQQRHLYERKVKRSDCYLKIGDVVTIILEEGTCHGATR